MKKLIQNIAPLGFMLSIPILNILYPLLNNSKGGVYSLVTDIDKITPFLKIFILPYIAWYAFIIGVLFYLCFKDRKSYYKTLIALDLSLIACYIIFYFFQTTVPRPELAGNDILTKLTAFIYSQDQPFNCFPSIHVATSYLMMKGINNSSIKSVKACFTVGCLSIIIILSTLFVKQHVILDVFSAILLGDMTFAAAGNISRARVLYWREKLYSLVMIGKKSET